MSASVRPGWVVCLQHNYCHKEGTECFICSCSLKHRVDVNTTYAEAPWKQPIKVDPAPLVEDVTRQAHYTSRKPEPVEVIAAWGLDFLEGNILKYLARWRQKDGVKDLKKCRQYLDWLIEREVSK